MAPLSAITELLGNDAKSLLEHRCTGITKESLHLPGPDWVDRMHLVSDRPTPILRSLQSLNSHGRLAVTGYLSILPVDQGIEHSAGASFAKNPIYFDPENIVKLAMEGGCNAVASTRQGDVVLVESTYGDHDHRPFLETVDEFVRIVKDTVEKRGKILVPTFAVPVAVASFLTSLAVARGLGLIVNARTAASRI